MSTAPFQSRDAVTKITRDGTQALLDFLAETEPEPEPPHSSTSRGPSLALGGLTLEKAKVRLGLLSKSKKKKVEEEGERGSGLLRINTPPPGTVAITRNSGHTVYMIGPPALPPPPVLRVPVPVPVPVLPTIVLPPQPSETPRPESRVEGAVHPSARDTRAIGVTLPNGFLDTRAVSAGHGRSRSHPAAAESTSVSHNNIHGSRDRHERGQPPSYHEATERISIFIDAHALQAIQESRGDFSVEFLEKIRAAQRDQYHFHSRSQSFTPLVQTTRRPLPPLPRTRSENVEAGYAHHHYCGGHTLPMHPITPDQTAVTPSEIMGRSESGVSKERTSRSCDKCECTVEHHPKFRPSMLGSHSGNADPFLLPEDRNSNLAASTDPKIPVPGRLEATAFAQVPNHRIEVLLPQHSSGTAEESLHIDELNVAERRSFSKMEKALLRKVEFGSKVDNSILQLC